MMRKLIKICFLSFLLQITSANNSYSSIDLLFEDLEEYMNNEIDLSPSKVLKRLADKISSNGNENDMQLTPYKYSYKTDTIEREEMGTVVDGKPTVMGAYTVNDPNGTKIMTVYTADKNGYKARTSFMIRQKRKLRESLVGK